MKKIILAVCFLMLAASLLAEESTSTVNGHDWDKMNDGQKVIYTLS